MASNTTSRPKTAAATSSATLPETSPTTQPFSLPAAAILEQGVQANTYTAFETATGLAFEIPPAH